MLSTSSERTLATRALTTIDELLRGTGERLAHVDPRVKRTLLRAREAYAHAFVRGIAAVNGLRYQAPPDPYRLCYVDPDDIQRVAEFPVSKFRLSGVVRGGSWDRTDERFEDLAVFRGYRRHFRDGVPWEETEFFERNVDKIEAGVERWGCTSRADFEARCRRLDDLYRTIRDEGYRTQTDLDDDDVADPVGRGRPERGHLADEIAVHIGRDGELLFEDGRNRLSIVKLLDVDEIPVRVLLRHREWQEIRDAYVEGAISPSSEVASHPDLRGLEPRAP